MFEFFHPEDRAHMRESFEQGNFDNRDNSLQSRIYKLIISIGSCYMKFLPFEPSMILAVLPFEIIVDYSQRANFAEFCGSDGYRGFHDINMAYLVS